LTSRVITWLKASNWLHPLHTHAHIHVYTRTHTHTYIHFSSYTNIEGPACSKLAICWWITWQRRLASQVKHQRRAMSLEMRLLRQ
jgi:hypothetical protein